MRFIVILVISQLVCNIVFASCADITLSGKINQPSLWRDLTVLSADDMQGRQSGTQGAKQAREYIASRFAAIGLSSFNAAPSYLQAFTREKWLSALKGVNVVGWLPGSIYEDEFIVVTAHYDHIGQTGRNVFNGADDNASGVAAMLAIAANIGEQNTKYSIIFVATDAEEKGLYGAKEFVKNPPVAIDKIKYNLNLDMLAQGGRKKRLYVSGAQQFSQFKPVVAKVISESGLCLVDGHKNPSKRFGQKSLSWRQASDHAAFASKGIAYLFVGVNVHPDYHTSHDEIDRIDPVFYTAAAETALKLLRYMDEL